VLRDRELVLLDARRQRGRHRRRRLEEQRRYELRCILRFGIERERATGAAHRHGARIVGIARECVASTGELLRRDVTPAFEVAITVEVRLHRFGELVRVRSRRRILGERGHAQRVELGRHLVATAALER